MSADTDKDLLASRPRDARNSAEGVKLEVAPQSGADQSANDAVRKVRSKRPRPTFEDGEFTRVFKFPSKTYPKSTYYVTGEEIIIRIRKARKKWKLVIPKKRIRTYRTNRWFAKPRWIELELTYTQAVRLRLVEPRPQAAEAAEYVSAALAGLPALAPGNRTDGNAASSEGAAGHVESEFAFIEPVDAVAEIDEAALDPEGSEPAHLNSTASEFDAALIVDSAGDDGDCEYMEDSEDPEDDDNEDEQEDDVAGDRGVASTQLPGVDEWQPSPLPACADGPLVQPPSRIEPVAYESPAQPSVAASGLGRSWPKRRAAASLMAMLAIVVTGSAVGWMTAGDFSSIRSIAQNPDGPACAAPVPSADCTDMIVTGSIRPHDDPVAQKVAQLEVTEGPTPTPVESPFPKVDAQDAVGTLIEPPVAQERPAFLATPTLEEMLEDKPGPRRLAVDATDAPQSSAVIDSDRGPSASDVTISPPRPEIELSPTDNCRGLSAAARSIDLPYGYASARLDHAALARLDHFASRLRSCPLVKVIIEGHTDGDGDAGRNQALSFRRAQAVWQYLVGTGTPPDQLWVIGFGPSRPLVPNTTAEDKQRNRRAVLIIEPPR